ncbi:O-antigen ligase family protein [Ilyomonas limi]|uniref:O-antigen ligase family protein n=1 Tax=Ilyomonas limi TaxID=2575867 RepID=A0A4U3KYF8_9BACT|nr:O-antigen ligase family protein [Ilyomonas limi]TKK66157.1 O-antigen ligase family protein [Ilyomonas limi]
MKTNLTFNKEKIIRFIGSVMLVGALYTALVENDSNYILLVFLPLVLMDRTFLIPLLFTIPLVEGVFMTESGASNAETIAIAMVAPVIGYDLLRKNRVNIPMKVLALFVIFIIMEIVGFIVYKQHPYISKTVAAWVNLPAVPVTGKTIARVLKLIFFIVYLKLLINYGKEYIYKALSLYRLLAPYIILAIVIYTLKYGIVAANFGGIIHFGGASHGDFTASLDAIAVFLFIAIFEKRKNYFEKVLSLVTLALLFYLIMNMGSRNGLVSFIFVTGISMILVLAKRSGSMTFLMMLAGVFAVAIAVILFADSPTINRFAYQMDEANGGERVDYWAAGLRAISEAPLFGMGGDETSSLYVVSKYTLVEPHVMHNTFLEVAVEYGLLGLLFYIIFVFTILRWGYKSYMYAIKTNDLVLAAPAVAYTVSIFAGLFISRVWETPLWYYLCLIFAIGTLWVFPQTKFSFQRRRKQALPSTTEPTYAYAD